MFHVEHVVFRFFRWDGGLTARGFFRFSLGRGLPARGFSGFPFFRTI